MQTLRAVVKFVRMLLWVVYGYWRIRTVFHKLEPQAHATAVEEWAQGMLAILGITVRVQGEPSKGPVLDGGQPYFLARYFGDARCMPLPLCS